MTTYADPVYIGIDPTAGRRPMHYAVLDGELNRLVEGSGAAEEVLAVAMAQPAATVAIDAPQSPNGGLLATPEQRRLVGLPPHSQTWSGYKLCEYELRRRGIGLYSTPTDPAAAPRWMQMGFRLYDGLREAGFVPYAPSVPAARRVLEVHPHACYTVLLGHLPQRKDSLEGRLQRQLVLLQEGLDVLDPMEALEELTPHRLLAASGAFVLPGLLDHDALDALVSAYTAYRADREPQAVTLVGDPVEGQIVLPIAPADLKPRYAR